MHASRLSPHASRPLRISLVDFLNARPLTWGLLHEPPAGVMVTRDLPSVCADKLASGDADVGLIPSIEYQRIPGLCVVPGLGIAASSEVRSVLLVSSVPRHRIRSVELDPASRTSATLVRILLKRLYGLEPEYRDGGRGTGDAASGPSSPESRVPSSGRADARLIIGDPALKARWNGQVVLDLAAEWRAFSGHSFVFALWAVRDDLATPAVAELLRRSFESGRRQFESLVAEEAAETGLSEAIIEDYLRHSLHYELGADDLAGLDLFYRLAAEDGWIQAPRRLALLPS
jgi:chorismate dehydratase